MDKFNINYIEIDNKIYRKCRMKVKGDYVNELTKINSLQSPYFKILLNIYYDGSYTYYNEEYINGEVVTTDYCLRLGEEKFIDFTCKLLTAMNSLHSVGIIHRDIKPANILIDKFDNVYLIDFDIIRSHKLYASKDTTVIGSEYYAPPEQYGYAQSSVENDIYTFGKTIIELFSETEYFNKYEVIFNKCTKFDPEQRYKSSLVVFDEIKNQYLVNLNEQKENKRAPNNNLKIKHGNVIDSIKLVISDYIKCNSVYKLIFPQLNIDDILVFLTSTIFMILYFFFLNSIAPKSVTIFSYLIMYIPLIEIELVITKLIRFKFANKTKYINYWILLYCVISLFIVNTKYIALIAAIIGEDVS